MCLFSIIFFGIFCGFFAQGRGVRDGGFTTSTDKSSPNYLCKNATSNWPACRPPFYGFKFRFGPGSADSRFPITAWWGPSGYGGHDTTPEIEAYAAAGFTIGLVSDRGPTHCSNNASRDAEESFAFILRNIAHYKSLGLTSLIDTYRCRPWGGPLNYGGYSQGSAGGTVSRTANHKITLPEVQWLSRQLIAQPSAVGLLITDDGVDLAHNEVSEIEWMRSHAAVLWPWVNQAGDGSEWLARAGTPYAVPELYSVTGPGGDAVAMASAQLSSYDSWIAKSLRFDLSFFPLINIGDGGDTGHVRSSSLVRFQAYACLAYGCQGFNWYCWGNGAWNFSGGSGAGAPSPIYPTIQEVNLRLNAPGGGKAHAWASILFDHPNWQGVYHTGWAGPSSSHSPCDSCIVASMDDNVLVGVLTQQHEEGALGSVLLVVVDKRVVTELNGPPPRIVTVVLNKKLVSSIIAVPGSNITSDPVHMSFTVTLNSGDGALIHIVGDADLLIPAARQLRQWRYNVDSPTLAAVKTTQYSYYNYYYKDRQTTNFLLVAADNLADVGSQSMDSAVAAAAQHGFSAVISTTNQLQSVLNAGLREGLFVFASGTTATEPVLTRADAAALVRAYGCHPNLAGFTLSFSEVAANNSVAISLAHSTTAYLKNNASNLLVVLESSSATDVVSVSEATGVPLAVLSLRSNVSDPAAYMQFVTQQLAAYHRLSLLHNLATALVASIPCPGPHMTVSMTRFGVFAALSFGARGIFYNGSNAVLVPGKASDAVAKINTAVAQWGDVLLSTRLSGFLSTASWRIEGAGGTFPGSNLITRMDPNLIVAVLQPSVSHKPPYLFVLDTRAQGGLLRFEVELDATAVYGWTPLIGDMAAGFSSCGMVTLGYNVALQLAAGEGVLISLSLFSD